MARTRYPARRLIDLPDLFSWDPFPTAQTAPENRMKVEQFRDNGDIVVRAEMPGLDPDNDVEIAVEDDIIRIAAERKQEKKEEEEDGTFRSEFHYGSFERTFRLPKDADGEAIQADYDKGILEVRIPVLEPETEEPRKIAISAKS